MSRSGQNRDRAEVTPDSVRVPPRTATRRVLLPVLAVIAGLVAPVVGAAPVSAATTCTTRPTIDYTVQVCAEVPDGVLSGTVTLAATVSVWPAAGKLAPAVKRVTFYFAGDYLLTDNELDGSGRYSMLWRTDRQLDTTGTLRVRAKLVDDATYDATTTATISNGVSTPFTSGRTFSVARGTTPDPGKPFRWVAVGDGADGSGRGDEVTAQIAAMQPNMLAYLGDVYERGSAYEYDNWYSTPNGYGRFRGITNPVVGNHEYKTAGAAGYLDYWGRDTPHFYSYDVGGWHVVAFDSNGAYNQLLPGTRQYEWLKDDLGANRARCTIAYMHHPRWSISGHKGKAGLAAVWALLADRRVTLAVSGHTHAYERWAPLDRTGVPDDRGVTQLIAGAGGHEAIPPLYADARAVTTAAESGALRLDLGTDGADYAYVTSTGEVRDSGFVGCKSTGDTFPPSKPSRLTAQATSATTAEVRWQPSTDEFAVGGYTVRRNGRVVATVGAGTTSFSDSGLVGGATYIWSVDAFDPSENISAQAPVSLTMPSPARPKVSSRTLLGQLPKAQEAPRGYRRTLFGGWADSDGDGCSTRAEVLVTEAQRPPLMTESCGLTGGRWFSTWNGIARSDLSLVGVGSAVPLAEAWQSGARRWSPTTRRALTNDLGYRETLTVATNAVLASRGSAEPQSWLPPRKAARCDYLANWVAVKWRWRLSVDKGERKFLVSRLKSCGWPTVAKPPRARITLR
jgi:hypothetical protein